MQDGWLKEVHRKERSNVTKERRHEDTEEHKYRLRTSCLDRFYIACAVFTNLKTGQSLPFSSQTYVSTNRLPLPQYAIRRARSQRCSAAFFLHLGMAASMIYSIPNLHRIHPHKILNLVIPNHIKLLLANGTRLVSKSWIGRYRNVLVLWICSGERRSKCGSCSIGRGICERSILRVIARFDPFLDFFSRIIRRDTHWNNLPTHQRTSFDSGRAWQSRPGVGSFGNASPSDAPSSLYPLLWRGIVYRMSSTGSVELRIR